MTMMNMDKNYDAAMTRVATAEIARVVRCRICGDLAFAEARERLNDDEVAVRYECTPCRWHQTRLFCAPQTPDGPAE
jgi:hypothetical protein